MSKGKELVCLHKDPFMAGAAVTVIPQAKGFREVDITEVFLDDPWWGVLDLTVETYNAVTYAAYTVAAPPAWANIMFNAARSAFKCGTALWFGKVMAMVTPVGARVLVS